MNSNEMLNEPLTIRTLKQSSLTQSPQVWIIISDRECVLLLPNGISMSCTKQTTSMLHKFLQTFSGSYKTHPSMCLLQDTNAYFGTMTLDELLTLFQTLHPDFNKRSRD